MVSVVILKAWNRRDQKDSCHAEFVKSRRLSRIRQECGATADSTPTLSHAFEVSGRRTPRSVAATKEVRGLSNEKYFGKHRATGGDDQKD
jgi:hypothetical protein